MRHAWTEGLGQTPAKGQVTAGLCCPNLGLSIFSVWLITITFQLLLLDIAETFDVNCGIVGLVAAVGSISGIIAGSVTVGSECPI